MSKKDVSYLESIGNEPLSLLCFSHAGGGSARYRSWHKKLSHVAEFIIPHLPGREGRILDMAQDNLEQAVDEILVNVKPWINKSLVIVGISYGALLAFETAVRLESLGVNVAALFVASQRAPQKHTLPLNWHKMEEKELISKLVALGGIDKALIESPEFCELFLTTIRADLHASENYCPMNIPTLSCPIHIWHGEFDEVIQQKDIIGWREVTANESFFHQIPAGHFLTDENRDLWLEDLISLTSSLNKNHFLNKVEK